MKRRLFLRGAAPAGVAAAAGAASSFPAPAIAQAMPEIKWRLTSSFPKSLDTLYGVVEYLSKRVAAVTDGKFQLQPFAAGEIVPALQVLDAVQAGTVECGHTAPYYYIGKDPTWAFGTSLPFGLNARQQTAWMYFGGGRELLNEFYKEYNVVGITCGNTATQMGGWFRKEIKTVDDLKGLKFRIGGFAGQVLAKLGVVPQQIGGGEIYQALEKGTVDAAEWVGPYDDQKLGFNKVAPNYYYPGWWEGGPQLDLLVNLQQWEKLPKTYQNVLEAASADAHNWMLGKYDAQNPKALRELVASGTKLFPFPQPVMEACFNAANELYAETTAKNAKFKKIYDNWKAFRADQSLWFQVADNTFDNFMIRQYRANKL